MTIVASVRPQAGLERGSRMEAAPDYGFGLVSWAVKSTLFMPKSTEYMIERLPRPSFVVSVQLEFPFVRKKPGFRVRT